MLLADCWLSSDLLYAGRDPLLYRNNYLPSRTVSDTVTSSLKFTVVRKPLGDKRQKM